MNRLLLNNFIGADELLSENKFKISRIHYSGGGDWYADPSSLPNLLNSDPTPAAPIVCQIVLSVNIAAKGTSISSFNSFSLFPLLLSSLRRISI